MRERYVQQKKVGGSPSYEHLSRPYLEKMKFLDNFIQSRKSYRQVSQLFTSPSGMQSFDGNESSKSNGSMRLIGAHLNNDLDDAFPQYYLNQFPHANLVVKSEESLVSDLHRKPNELQSSNNNMTSSSSSIASQESPATLISNSTTHEIDDTSVTRKRRRTTSTNISERNNSHNLNHMERTHDQQQILNNHILDNVGGHNSNDDDDDASDHESSPMNNVPTDFLYPLYEQQSSRNRKPPPAEHANPTSSTFPNPVDLLNPLYQQVIARQLRNSDQLLGELVTSELMKMPKDRKRVAQRKILEILFFDDE